MASRVVPGMSLTIARSSPRSELSRLDLPTFGRPTKAMAAGRTVGLGGDGRVPAAASQVVRVELGGLPFPVGVALLRARPRRTAPARPAATSSAKASASASRSLRASSCSLSGGSDQTTTSSRSAVPRPCVAEIG